MLWLVAEDQEYYKHNNNETVKDTIMRITQKLSYEIPNINEIREFKIKLDQNISVEELGDTGIAILSPVPPRLNTFFVVKRLPNVYKIETSQQRRFKENLNDSLYQRFGLTIKESSKTLNDLRGYHVPKEEIMKAIKLLKQGHIRKILALFLGVSGAGKSYFAECLAGELGKKIVNLDMGILMEGENPIGRLNDFFRFIQEYDDYVLLMDEIEKPANPDGVGAAASMAKMYIGQLLTIFNELNTPNGYQIKDNPIIATANNIGTLLDKNPEFINRFNLRYFIDYPAKPNAIEIFDYYIKSSGLKGVTAEDLFYLSDVAYRDFKPRELSGKNACIYAPREIFFLIEHLVLASEDLAINQEIAREVILRNSPQAQYANKGVLKTIANGINGFVPVD